MPHRLLRKNGRRMLLCIFQEGRVSTVKNTLFQKLTGTAVSLSLLLSSADFLPRTAASDTVYTALTVCDGIGTASLSAGGVGLSVTCPADAGLPDGTLLSFEEIGSDSARYSSYFAQSDAAVSGDLTYARFFDISFLYEGAVIEPAAPVSVGLTYDRPELDAPTDQIQTDVIHFAAGQPVLMDAALEQDVPQTDGVSDRMTFETDSFSAYGILFYHSDDHQIGSRLDGMSFALANWNQPVTATGRQTNVPALMGAYKQNSRLASRAVTVYPASQIDAGTDSFTHYIISDTDVTEWTFTWISDNNYYITAQVDGVTKYLTLYSYNVTVNGSSGGRVELLDAPDPDGYSVITVQNNGTGNNADKLRLVNKNLWALNLKGQNISNGYQTYLNTNNSQWTEWFVPAILTDASVHTDQPVNIVTHTADKVSVSDTERLTDGTNVVIYSKVWDNDAREYVNYAIDGSGKLVRVWESGGVIQWKDKETTGLYWQFIQHGDSGYYDFYNPVTGMYLAPQNGQILSNSTIGVTLNGRENGEYTSTLEAWDNNVWSWYGFRYTNGLTVQPVPDTQSAQMCFAVQRPEGEFLPVGTVDSKAAGITIKMYDYPSDAVQNSILINKQYVEGGGAITGLVENQIGGDGFPVATQGSHKSLAPLFTDGAVGAEREVNHLFIKSTYDETGYFEYSCFDTSAFLMKQDGSGGSPSEEGYDGVYDFTVRQELVSPGNNNQYSSKRGNFLPYNGPQAGENGSSARTNLYLPNNQSIPDENPRKGEHLYTKTYNTVDHYFGMSIDAQFMIPENGCDDNGNPLIFEFTGDDDFWLFVDDVLVLDLGGIHNALNGKIDFSTGEVLTYKGHNDGGYNRVKLVDCFRAAGVFPDGTPWDESLVASYFKNDGSFESDEGIFKDYSSHSMKIYYMERGAGASNLKLRFNLATVPERSIFLEKKLTGTQTTDYSNTRYAYQLYYRMAGSTEFTLYENPADEASKAHYEKQNGLVPYDAEAVINGTEYQNVFYLRAGEKAEFTMPGRETEYYFKEIGVLNQEYDYVNINGERAYDSDFHTTGEKAYAEVASDADTVLGRKRVIYENHIDPDYLKKLIVTKRLVTLVSGSETDVDNDRTGFEFQVYFLDEAGEPVPYRKGEYYVTDADGFYYTYVNGKLSKYGKEKTVCGVSGNNGSIAGIPDGLSVVIENLLPTTEFMIEEQDDKIPAGYERLRYERDGGTYHLIAGKDINYGIIRENTNAHMNVVNQKGFGITVDKDWGDRDYTEAHDPIYIALFAQSPDGPVYVPDTFRELVSPNTSVYYFSDAEEANRFSAMEVRPDSIQPADWGGSTDAVTDCAPYAAGDTVSLSAVTTNGETHEFAYQVGYEQGEIGGTGMNTRRDTITNARNHLQIVKQSAEGAPLSGAVFRLTDITGGGEVLLGSFTSDAGGLVTNAYFTAEHSYRLTELSAPDGFHPLTESITVNVDADGQIHVQYAGDADDIVFAANESGGVLTVKNRPGRLNLRKTDTAGNPLRGAVFRLWRYDVSEGRRFALADADALISDENGIFCHRALTSGYYLIEEVTPPSGYAMPGYDVVMHIRLADNAVDQLYTVEYDSETGTYQRGADRLGEWASEADGSTTVSLPNSPVTANLIIRKTIDGIDATKGYPAFLFRAVQRKDGDGNTVSDGPEFIRMITFDASDTAPDKEVQISGLPVGTYLVEELGTRWYTPAGVTVSGDDSAVIGSPSAASVTMRSPEPVTVSFRNEMQPDSGSGYTAYAENRIRYAGGSGE